jgi:hypothetical protein
MRNCSPPSSRTSSGSSGFGDFAFVYHHVIDSSRVAIAARATQFKKLTNLSVF